MDTRSSVSWTVSSMKLQTPPQCVAMVVYLLLTPAQFCGTKFIIIDSFCNTLIRGSTRFSCKHAVSSVYTVITELTWMFSATTIIVGNYAKKNRHSVLLTTRSAVAKWLYFFLFQFATVILGILRHVTYRWKGICKNFPTVYYKPQNS